MGMQKVVITLKALAESGSSRSKRGIVCLILDDPKVVGLHTYTRFRNVKEEYSEENKAVIRRCFADRAVKNLKVVCYNSKAQTPEIIDEALTILNDVKFNYLACPTVTTDEEKKKVSQFIKDQRKNNNILVKAVLHNHEADYEGVINFVNKEIIMTDKTKYTGQQFTVDIACLAANCGFNSSLTNMIVEGVKSVDVVGEDLDTLVDEGKIFMFYDNDLESVVISKAVNSKITIAPNEKEALKKIRIVDILDTIRDDIKVTFKKYYQGKVSNTLSNKRLFVSAVNTYLRSMKKQGALNDGEKSEIWLNVEAQKNYLEDERGWDCSEMKDEEILKSDSGENVFTAGSVRVVDTAENLELDLNY
ncbi:phage tail sheath protein [Clostridium botulinum]|nr:phage tail sheath protein [Clostridium botulinum]NFP01845.1 phage tail sheath protein [Clostridium botulinum]